VNDAEGRVDGIRSGGLPDAPVVQGGVQFRVEVAALAAPSGLLRNAPQDFVVADAVGIVPGRTISTLELEDRLRGGVHKAAVTLAEKSEETPATGAHQHRHRPDLDDHVLCDGAAHQPAHERLMDLRRRSTIRVHSSEWRRVQEKMRCHQAGVRGTGRPLRRMETTSPKTSSSPNGGRPQMRVAACDDAIALSADHPVGYKSLVAIAQDNPSGEQFGGASTANASDVSRPDVRAAYWPGDLSTAPLKLTKHLAARSCLALV